MHRGNRHLLKNYLWLRIIKTPTAVSNVCKQNSWKQRFQHVFLLSGFTNPNKSQPHWAFLWSRPRWHDLQAWNYVENVPLQLSNTGRTDGGKKKNHKPLTVCVWTNRIGWFTAPIITTQLQFTIITFDPPPNSYNWVLSAANPAASKGLGSKQTMWKHSDKWHLWKSKTRKIATIKWK